MEEAVIEDGHNQWSEILEKWVSGAKIGGRGSYSRRRINQRSEILDE